MPCLASSSMAAYASILCCHVFGRDCTCVLCLTSLVIEAFVEMSVSQFKGLFHRSCTHICQMLVNIQVQSASIVWVCMIHTQCEARGMIQGKQSNKGAKAALHLYVMIQTRCNVSRCQECIPKKWCRICTKRTILHSGTTSCCNCAAP